MDWNSFLNTVVKEWKKCLEKDTQYVNYSSEQLSEISWHEVEMLLKDLKNWEPKDIILNGKRKVNLEDRKKLLQYLKARKRGIPLAYILGKQEFCQMEFKVNRHTLIPRPETEELVKDVVNEIERTDFKNRKVYFIDIGTGSGCIAVSVLKKLSKPFEGIYVTDICSEALKIAKRNISFHLKGKYPIEVIKSSLLDFLKDIPDNSIFFIAANLPYLSKEEYDSLSREVRKEPINTLLGGEEGFEQILKLIDQIEECHLKNQSSVWKVFLEISPDLVDDIKESISKRKISFSLQCKRDMYDKVRFAKLLIG